MRGPDTGVGQLGHYSNMQISRRGITQSGHDAMVLIITNPLVPTAYIIAGYMWKIVETSLSFSTSSTRIPPN
jgi:malate/lactate dehydrogenase